MISFNNSLWPLLLVTFEGESSDQEFEAHLQTMSEYLQRQEKYLCVYDARKMGSSPINHRQMQIEWLKANDAQLRQWMIGTGFVITSPLARLAMNVITMLNKPPCPSTGVATFDQAMVWAADRFREEGMMLPSVRIRTHFNLIQPVKRAVGR